MTPRSDEPASPLATLGWADLRRTVEAFRDALRAHQDELNRLNVYPVPDGDTGTNMTLTLEAVCTELRDADDMADVCRAMSRGSLMGARGNSGVITSQLLRGVSDELHALAEIGPADVVRALRRATDMAYQAVLRPVEGTILTVVRETTEALEATAPQTLRELVDVACRAAEAATAHTPDLLPVLKSAGVVDAGGKGFTLLVGALAHVIDGRTLPVPEAVATPPAVAAHLAGEDVAGLRYEVMYLLDAPDATIPALRAAWGAIGDSIVIVGGDGLWNCHIHTDEIGPAIEAGVQAGRPHEIRVTDLFDQVHADAGSAGRGGVQGHGPGEEADWVRAAVGDCDADADADDGGAPPATGIVAVAVGEGLRRLLRSLGVQRIVAGGQSMNPSTAEILEAVEASRSDAVIVLPNNKNIVPVARQVDALTSKHVEVVPTTSVIEAIAALVAYDPDESLAANTAALSEEMARVRAGEVTQAVRDGVGECGPIVVGSWLAISRDGGIVATAPDAAGACMALLDQLVDDDCELVTLLVGHEARSADTERITQHLELAHPQVELECHNGDQPLYAYLVGVE